MPAYTYNCHECDATFDRIRVVSDDRDKQSGCPKCADDQAKISREEVADVGAPMKHNWGRWSGF